MSALRTAIALVAMSQAARAGQLAYEGFGPSFPIYANGGTGFDGPWIQGGFNAFASGYVPQEASLRFGKLHSSGGSIAGGAFPRINGAIRDLAQPLGLDNTTVYYSFVLEPQGTLNAGVFNGFFGLTLNGSVGNDLFVGKPGGGAQEEYVIEARGGAGQLSSGTATVVGCAALLVVKAEFLPGNDSFTLYVNPGREPGDGVVKTDLDLGIVSQVGIYSTGAFIIDEIRIGTTYADVVPTRFKGPHHGRGHENWLLGSVPCQDELVCGKTNSPVIDGAVLDGLAVEAVPNRRDSGERARGFWTVGSNCHGRDH